MIKRLAYDHPKIKGGITHVCTVVGCGSFFELKKTKGNWVTTKAVNHIKKCHPTSALGIEYLKAEQTADVSPKGLLMYCAHHVPSPKRRTGL